MPTTRTASAIWWTRSPKRLIIWPVHSAVNEPLRASRTYGWRRTRSSDRRAAGRRDRARRRRARRRGRPGRARRDATADTDRPPAPRTPRARSGRRPARAAEDERPIERARSGRAADRRRPDRGCRRRVDPARQPGRAGEPVGSCPSALGLRPPSSSSMPDDRREQEEREPGRQEHVADGGDVLDDRQRDRQDVAERPGVEEEVEAGVRQQDRVERREDVLEAKAGGLEARIQIGMWPALAAIAIVFDRIPTNASACPGCERLTHRETRSRRNDVTNSGRRNVSTTPLPWISASLRPEAEDRPRTRAPPPAQPDRGEVADRPPARRPRINPRTMPPISMDGHATRSASGSARRSGPSRSAGACRSSVGPVTDRRRAEDGRQAGRMRHPVGAWAISGIWRGSPRGPGPHALDPRRPDEGVDDGSGRTGCRRTCAARRAPARR